MARDYIFFELTILRVGAFGRPARTLAYVFAIIVAAATLPLIWRLIWLFMDFP